MALGRPRSRVGLSSPPNTSSTSTRLSRHSSLPPYVHAIHTSYSHRQLNTHLFAFPSRHAIYHNFSLAHPTRKAWTLSFQPTRKVHQDKAVSARMTDQTMEISSTSPHPLAPPDRIRLSHTLFFPIDSCHATPSAAPSSDPS